MAGTILGAVIAGGASRRFGSDKAQALLAGRPLIAHAIDALRAHVDAIVVCGRDMEGLATLRDRPEGGQGPLAGLNAALHHAAAGGYAGVMSIGCDMPMLPPAAAAALIGDGNAAAVIAGQHLLGYWPSALATALDAHLARGDDRSIRGWLARIGARAVALPGVPLPNINTVEDLASLAAGWQG